MPRPPGGNTPKRSGGTKTAEGGQRQIWILKDGRPQPLTVTTGLSDGRRTEVSGEGLTEGDAHVFDRMVAVDVQVACAVDVQVDQAVAGNLFEHVVKEADARVQLGLARAVEVDAHGDARLGGVAADFGNAVGRGVDGGRGDECGGGHKEAWSAASMVALSWALPTVRRKQLCSNGCIVETFLIRTLRVFMPS